MRRVNVNLYPKNGGYAFQDSDGAWIRGENWREVIARVVQYRKRAGYPPGDPENEVHSQGCNRNPNLCIDDQTPAAQETKRGERRMTVKGAVLQWFAKMLRRAQARDIRFIATPEEVKAREAVCVLCPHNTDYPGGCASCAAAIKENRRSVLGKRPISSARLNACAMLGEDTATSVYLDEHRVNNPELPANCWRKAQS